VNDIRATSSSCGVLSVPSADIERCSLGTKRRGTPMRLQFLTCIAVVFSLTGQAIAQRADIEIGVLTCTLEAPSNPPGATIHD
jgi:hypothetical protein